MYKEYNTYKKYKEIPYYNWISTFFRPFEQNFSPAEYIFLFLLGFFGFVFLGGGGCYFGSVYGSCHNSCSLQLNHCPKSTRGI